ncbi:MAG: RHS repeat protein [Methylococcaceae bacterium]
MPNILMLKYKNGYQPIRRSTTEHRSFGQRKTVVRPIRFSLAKTGTGAGALTSSPLGIDCGVTCSATFTPGSVVTLTAPPATGSTFGGWFGACTGTATTCTVTLNQASSVNASFSAPAITTYQYDANGNLTQITDPLGRIRQTQCDTLNQAVRQLEPHAYSD